TVTISIGAVAGDNSEMHIHSPSDLLRRADKALYEAKQAGRNCVRIVGLTEENSSPDDMGLSISIDS
ncbi:MAG TPA: diguanylate cyclase, partial [Edaphobacter sp.]